MQSRRMWIPVLGAIAVLAGACGSQTAEVDEAREAEWAWLEEARAELGALRAEYGELSAGLEASGEELEEGAEAVDPEALAQELEAKEKEIAARADEFANRLVTYLNADPMIEGEPPTERQLAAIRMKSEEDLVLAQEYIDKGGDYRRAIGIMEDALRLDPDNELVKAALAEAEARRFVTEERLAQIKDGMDESQVRAILGQVNLRNIRQYPDRKVVAWFYPTSDAGDAAAVYFREDRSGAKKVYEVKFDAVKAEELAGSAGG